MKVSFMKCGSSTNNPSSPTYVSYCGTAAYGYPSYRSAHQRRCRDCRQAMIKKEVSIGRYFDVNGESSSSEDDSSEDESSDDESSEHPSKKRDLSEDSGVGESTSQTSDQTVHSQNSDSENKYLDWADQSMLSSPIDKATGNGDITNRESSSLSDRGTSEYDDMDERSRSSNEPSASQEKGAINCSSLEAQPPSSSPFEAAVDSVYEAVSATAPYYLFTSTPHARSLASQLLSDPDPFDFAVGWDYVEPPHYTIHNARLLPVFGNCFLAEKYQRHDIGWVVCKERFLTKTPFAQASTIELSLAKFVFVGDGYQEPSIEVTRCRTVLQDNRLLPQFHEPSLPLEAVPFLYQLFQERYKRMKDEIEHLNKNRAAVAHNVCSMNGLTGGGTSAAPLPQAESLQSGGFSGSITTKGGQDTLFAF